ncbi:MAG: hypothetical protein IJ368_10335 [Oscillospiraceae bacterium]|nr:hypothetical protein [Oscillospiraceae bacterium]
MKRILKTISSGVLAVVIALQCMAVAVSADIMFQNENGVSASDIMKYYNKYFYYKGIYYSHDTDAANATGGNSGGYETIMTEQMPKGLQKKWLDPNTGRLFETEVEAEVYYGVFEAHLVWIDPKYKEDAEDKTASDKKTETDKKTDESTKTDTNKKTDTSKKTTANKKTSSKKAAAKDGEPYIFGKKTQAGWSVIAKKAASMKSGSLQITMNGCEVIDKSVLEAVKGKAVTLVFTMKSGARWTIKGSNVTKAADINAAVEYNTKNIPSKLVKEVSENAVSKTQLTVSDTDNSFGTKATVKIKFSKKRADLKAVVYRYDADKDTLKKVSSSTVKSDGSCSFTAKAGGSYLVVLE